MANFDDLKQAFFSKLGTVADKTRGVAAQTADKAKDLAGKAADKAGDVKRITKLNIDLSTDKENLKKAYTELGKLCYTNRGADPDGAQEQMFGEIAVLLEGIAAKEAELAELKSKPEAAAEPEIEVEVVDFEQAVEAVEAEAEAAADAVEEAVEEITEE